MCRPLLSTNAYLSLHLLDDHDYHFSDNTAANIRALRAFFIISLSLILVLTACTENARKGSWLLSCFAILSTTFYPCAISLKSTLGPPNMADQYCISWYGIDIIINNTLGALDQLLLHYEETKKIPKELSELIGHDAKKSNTYGNEPHTMTKVEATLDLKQRF